MILGKFLLVICTVHLHKFAYAAVAQQSYVKTPASINMNQGGCYVPSLHRVLPYDKPYSLQDGMSCMQFLCQRSNQTVIESCGSMGKSDGCMIIRGDRNLPFTKCCNRVFCFRYS